jgi:hypothetical protein
MKPEIGFLRNSSLFEWNSISTEERERRKKEKKKVVVSGGGEAQCCGWIIHL